MKVFQVKRFTKPRNVEHNQEPHEKATRKKVQVGKDQEKAQSERDSHSLF